MNKIHIIEDHLEDFFEKFKTTFKNKSDQTMESTHQELNSRMQSSKYVVKNFISDIHGTKLKRAIIHFNSYNVGYSH